ncbi:MAG: hypothetical protein K1W17_10720, partial [Oscillospiraceae bacterium]
PQEGGAVVFAPPRNGSRHSSPLSPFWNERGFRALRSATRGSAPSTPASWAQLDQLIFGRVMSFVS